MDEERKEILNFMKCDYEQYCWSTATLDRTTFRFFDISNIHYNTLLETVSATVQKELVGTSKLLCYRALYQKLRMQHEVQVPRNLAHKMLQNKNPLSRIIYFAFPERYGGTKDVFHVRVDLLREVAEVSKVLQEALQNFLDVLLSTGLQDLIPHPEELKPTETMNAFLYLKDCTFS